MRSKSDCQCLMSCGWRKCREVVCCMDVIQRGLWSMMGQFGVQKPKKDDLQEGQDREKPKATTKAERRAKQEAQRAAKEAGGTKVAPPLLHPNQSMLHTKTALFGLSLVSGPVWHKHSSSCHAINAVGSARDKPCCSLCVTPFAAPQTRLVTSASESDVCLYHW